MSDWTRFAAPEILARRQLPTTPATFRCYCCGASYERGKFECCAPPKGMAAHKWRELTDHAGCGRCWRHCVCANKQDRVPKGRVLEWQRFGGN